MPCERASTKNGNGQNRKVANRNNLITAPMTRSSASRYAEGAKTEGNSVAKHGEEANDSDVRTSVRNGKGMDQLKAEAAKQKRISDKVQQMKEAKEYLKAMKEELQRCKQKKIKTKKVQLLRAQSAPL